MTVLCLPFQCGFLLFLFLLWLLWLGLLKLCWIKVAGMGILVFFLILEEMLSAFHHWIYCDYGLVIYSLYCVEVSSLYTHFFESFYYKWVLNFVKCFFCIYWDDHMIFILQYVNMVYYIDLQILNHPYIPGINATWSWGMILLMYCWIWFANILQRIFAFMFISDIDL